MTKRMRWMAVTLLVGAAWMGGAAAARADTIGTFQWARCDDDDSPIFGTAPLTDQCFGPGLVFLVQNTAPALKFVSVNVVLDGTTPLPLPGVPTLIGDEEVFSVFSFLDGGSAATARLDLVLEGGLPAGFAGLDLPTLTGDQLVGEIQLTQVPEPSSMMLLGIGVVLGALCPGARHQTG